MKGAAAAGKRTNIAFQISDLVNTLLLQGVQALRCTSHRPAWAPKGIFNRSRWDVGLNSARPGTETSTVRSESPSPCTAGPGAHKLVPRREK